MHIHCRAFKFKNEAPGMCSAGEKVKLKELHTIRISRQIVTEFSA